MKTINLFGSGVESINPALTAQRRVNVFYDVRADGDKSRLVIKGTPGLTLFCQLPTSPIRGMIAYNGFLYVVAGNVLYQVNNVGGWVNLGSFGPLAATTPVSMCINETQMLIVDGTAGYVFPYSNISSKTIALNSYVKEIQSLTNICLATGND